MCAYYRIMCQQKVIGLQVLLSESTLMRKARGDVTGQVNSTHFGRDTFSRNSRSLAMCVLWRLFEQPWSVCMLSRIVNLVQNHWRTLREKKCEWCVKQNCAKQLFRFPHCLMWIVLLSLSFSRNHRCSHSEQARVWESVCLNKLEAEERCSIQVNIRLFTLLGLFPSLYVHMYMNVP